MGGLQGGFVPQWWWWWEGGVRGWGWGRWGGGVASWGGGWGGGGVGGWGWGGGGADWRRGWEMASRSCLGFFSVEKRRVRGCQCHSNSAIMMMRLRSNS